MIKRPSCYLFLVFLLFGSGCANITMPTGGRKDTTPPKMVSIDPHDSLRNTRVNRLEMHFDEYITLTDPGKEVQLSPILTLPPTATSHNKTVVIKIVDSLLEPNTTYRLSMGAAIRDLHEGNALPPYTYTFSTGAYFDSLQLHGNVINAATGLPDTGSYTMALYSASETDSAVVRHKPRYVTRTDAQGNYVFKGLPHRSFRLYAIKDQNGNLFYDGPLAGESVGFTDGILSPSDSASANIAAFTEIIDSAAQKAADTTSIFKRKGGKGGGKTTIGDALNYSVNVDTANLEARSFDITTPLIITFSRQPIINKEKITLTYDSLGMTITPVFTYDWDTIAHRLMLFTAWREDKAYRLRLVKGFAKDTAGAEAVPSRYNFRTKEDGDYGRINLNLPARYANGMYVLRVLADGDSVYQQPVTNAAIALKRLKPAKYTIRLIVDKNHNGKWDTGDLLARRQPEEVIPYRETISLKQGWENNVDDFGAPPPASTKDKAKPKLK